MLTESGEALNDVGPAPLRAFSAEPSPGIAAVTGDGAAGENETPVWDAGCRELRLRGQIVKRFKVPSPIQESILAAFQEEGWPSAIDDPLPPHPEQDQRRVCATRSRISTPTRGSSSFTSVAMAAASVCCGNWASTATAAAPPAAVAVPPPEFPKGAG